MKVIQWQSLLMVVLAINSLTVMRGVASDAPPTRPPAPPKVPPVPKVPAIPEMPALPKVQVPRAAERPELVVDGYGETADKARDRALERAQQRVEELLRERFGPTGWMPPSEQLEPEYLARFNVIQPKGEPEPAPPVMGEKMLVARYRVDLNSDYLEAVIRQARQQTIQYRHLIFARILGGMVALFLVTAGYLRLEESTRGYATKLLRLLAVLVLAVVGAGLWLTA